MRSRPVPVCCLCGKQGQVKYERMEDRLYFVAGSWRLEYCSACKIAWLNPQPVPEDLWLAYASNYYTHKPLSCTAVPPDEAMGRTPLKRALRGMVLSGRYGYHPFRPGFPGADLIGRLLSFIPVIHGRATRGWFRSLPPFRSQGKLLDIGCGNGEYLAGMKEFGWEVYGIEPDREGACMAEKNAGAKVWVGTVEDVDIPERMFDAVASMHVIEHAYHPTRFVQRTASLLKPGGFLYIVTPNFNSLGRRLHQKDCYSLQPPCHLNLLTPRSLQSVCESTGLLRVTSVRTLTRLGRKEVEQLYTLRKTGRFKAEYHLTFLQRFSARAFDWLETVGNPFFQWGEEIEVIAQRI